jgi:hypothetical protein
MTTICLHPSAPKSPKGVHPPPLTPVVMLPQPDYANILPHRPSDGWLLNPAWIGTHFFHWYLCTADHWVDGGSNPPIYFYSIQEIKNMLQAYHPDHSRVPVPFFRAPTLVPSAHLQHPLVPVLNLLLNLL